MAALAFVFWGRPAIATTFFDDLAATNGGSETVSGTRWIAGSFTTDNSAYTSLTATLLMSQASVGSAQLDLYSNTGLQPNNLLGTFTSPSSYSSSLAEADFTLSGVSLSANTTYWVLLKASSGSFNWGWTSDFTVMQGWADSTNSGSVWFTGDAFPFQYSVVSGITSPSVAGDYNQDGTVDAADYVVWRKQNGTSASGLAADGDGSGAIDTDDYTYWRNRFGNTSGSGSGSSGLETSAIPEPAPLAMMIVPIGLMLFAFNRRCESTPRLRC